MVLFWRTRLYADATLQIVFAVLAGYGWYQWLRVPVPGAELPVRRTSRAEWVVLSAATMLGHAAVYWGLSRHTDSPVPFWDSAVLALSLAATYGQARKLVESWILWIVVDVISVPLYIGRGLYLTSGLYFVFLCLCVNGYFRWRADLLGRRPLPLRHEAAPRMKAAEQAIQSIPVPAPVLPLRPRPLRRRAGGRAARAGARPRPPGLRARPAGPHRRRHPRVRGRGPREARFLRRPVPPRRDAVVGGQRRRRRFPPSRPRSAWPPITRRPGTTWRSPSKERAMRWARCATCARPSRSTRSRAGLPAPGHSAQGAGRPAGRGRRPAPRGGAPARATDAQNALGLALMDAGFGEEAVSTFRALIAAQPRRHVGAPQPRQRPAPPGRPRRRHRGLSRARARGPGQRRGLLQPRDGAEAEGRFRGRRWPSCAARSRSIPRSTTPTTRWAWCSGRPGGPRRRWPRSGRPSPASPTLADAHYMLGTILRQQGRLDDALAAFREAHPPAAGGGGGRI